MVKIRSDSYSLNIQFNFDSPLFDWQSASFRFFEMIYSALTPDLTISAREFTQTGGTSLGDLVVQYNIFGGTNYIALSAENLSIDFENLSRIDNELALNIIKSVESGFLEKFSDCKYSTIRVTVFEHVTVIEGDSATDYLARYAIQSVHKVCSEVGAKQFPTGRFFIKGIDWNARCFVEESIKSPNSLFLNFDMSILNVDQNDDFDKKADRVGKILNTCTSALELERINVS